MLRRLIFASLVPVIAATLAISPTLARAEDGGATVFSAATSLTPGRYVWEADAAAGPVAILISIPDQRMYVYRGDALVAASTVSTGKDGNDTPVGIFTILQKKEFHRSNKYDDAPMPYMQRLTWDGVAIHAGRNPGFPASHGCIRVPTAFAKKLFAATAMGATVEVTDLPVVDGMEAPIGQDAQTVAANKAAAQELKSFLASAD